MIGGKQYIKYCIVIVTFIIVISLCYKHVSKGFGFFNIKDYIVKNGLQTSVTKVPEENCVELKMFVIGDEPLDFQLVISKVNEILAEKIDVKLKVEFINEKNTGIDYHEVFAGGADFDLISILPYHYNIFANRLAYMNITDDMLKKCAPSTFKKLSDNLIKDIRMDSKLYMIPSEATIPYNHLAIVRGDLMEKYSIEKIESLAELENYLKAISINEENIIPYDVGNNGFEIFSYLYLEPNDIQLYDHNLIGLISNHEKIKLVWLPETEYFYDFLKTINKWKEYNLIPKNASAKKKVTKESFLNGKSGLYIGNVYEIINLQQEVLKNNPNYQPKIINISSNNKNISWHSYLNYGIAIKNGSQNAAKSLMFIELLRTDEKIYRLLNYGIEGIHYRNEKDTYIPLLDNYRYPIYNNYTWQMVDSFKLKDPYFSNIFEEPININKNKLKYYSIDTKDIELDFKYIEYLKYNYAYPLSIGAFNNWEEALFNYKLEMKKFGFEDYYNKLCEKYDLMQSENNY